MKSEKELIPDVPDIIQFENVTILQGSQKNRQIILPVMFV